MSHDTQHGAAHSTHTHTLHTQYTQFLHTHHTHTHYMHAHTLAVSENFRSTKQCSAVMSCDVRATNACVMCRVCVCEFLGTLSCLAEPSDTAVLQETLRCFPSSRALGVTTLRPTGPDICPVTWYTHTHTHTHTHLLTPAHT